MASEAAGFSTGETKLMMSILKNLKGNVDSDWDQVALEMGYKDSSIAKTRWGQIKKKKLTGKATSSPVQAGGIDKSAPSHVNTTQPKQVTGGGGAAAGTKPVGRKPKSKKTPESNTEQQDFEEQLVKQEEEEAATI